MFLLVSISVLSQKKQVIGKWKDINLPYEYEFKKEIASFKQSGYGVTMHYKIDSTKTPMFIDFTIKRGRTITIPGLLKWKTKDTLWIQQFPPYPNHPTKFDLDSTSLARKIHILVRAQ